MLQKIKNFLSKGNNAQWCVFILFAFTIFIKCVLFHWTCFHSILISSLWKNPIDWWLFYLPKIAFSVIIASVIFITKRKYWSIYFLVLLDLWCLANLVYYRSNAALLDNFSFSMAGNMDGYWSSVLFLIYPQDSVFFIITLLYGLSFLFLDNRQVSWKMSLISIIVGYLLSIGGQFLMTQKKEYKSWYPMYFEPFSQKVRTNIDYTGWIKRTSLLHSFGCIVCDFYNSSKAKNVKLEKEDIEKFNTFISPYNKRNVPKYNLIVILVESLESWAITQTAMPNLSNFMRTHHCLYANKITKQTKAGTSMDGQIIVNTGLLPINQGAICFLFADNMFPSIADVYDQSRTILPHEITDWNQRRMSPAMHFDSTLVKSINDTFLAQSTLENVHRGCSYIQTITLASHIPFEYGEQHSKLDLTPSMPKYMGNYLKSLNCTDAGFKVLFDAFDTDSCLSNTIFVITGDHTIFTQENRDEYSTFCRNNNLDYTVTDAFCPLIIYSPSFSHNIQITDTCYQMDIYPTIMHLIGCEDYYWKGFGVNLLDSTARHNRPISEKEAYELSDKLIRSNYFATLKE